MRQTIAVVLFALGGAALASSIIVGVVLWPAYLLDYVLPAEGRAATIFVAACAGVAGGFAGAMLAEVESIFGGIVPTCADCYRDRRMHRPTPTRKEA